MAVDGDAAPIENAEAFISALKNGNEHVAKPVIRFNFYRDVNANRSSSPLEQTRHSPYAIIYA